MAVCPVPTLHRAAVPILEIVSEADRWRLGLPPQRGLSVSSISSREVDVVVMQLRSALGLPRSRAHHKTNRLRLISSDFGEVRAQDCPEALTSEPDEVTDLLMGPPKVGHVARAPPACGGDHQEILPSLDASSKL